MDPFLHGNLKIILHERILVGCWDQKDRKNKWTDCPVLPSCNQNTIFYRECNFVKFVTRAGNVIAHWLPVASYHKYFSNLIFHHTCMSHINSLHHGNRPRTNTLGVSEQLLGSSGCRQHSRRSQPTWSKLLHPWVLSFHRVLRWQGRAVTLLKVSGFCCILHGLNWPFELVAV